MTFMRANTRQRGFTMIEIMTVVVIVAIMMGVAYPSMRSMNEKNKLRATAREIIALMKYARTEAVMGERRTAIFLDLDKREYWMDLRTPDPKTGEYNPRAKRTQLEQKRDLNKDIWFEEVSTYESNVVKGKLIAVDFYPDGSATPILLTLTNKRGSKMTVELLKSTGLTEVSPGSIEEKQALQAAESGGAVSARRMGGY
jgi:type II secretion system protein H